MKIIVCEPNHKAKVVDTDGALETLQAIVDGNIEPMYLDDGVVLICNEEGKINGMEQNRVLFANGKIADIIHGTFFLCGVDGEELADIPEDVINMYCHLMNATSVYFLNRKHDWILRRHSHRDYSEEDLCVESDEETLADAGEVVGAES